MNDIIPVPTPAAAAAEMRRLCETLEGDALHKAFDAFTNRILRGNGYGEAVDIFLKVVEGRHG